MSRRPADNYTLRKRQERMAASPTATAARRMLAMLEAGQVHHVSRCWTRTQDVQLLRGMAAGLSVPQIAAQLGVHADSVTARARTLLTKARPGRGDDPRTRREQAAGLLPVLRKRGEDRRPAGEWPWYHDVIVLELYASGVGQTEIADRLQHIRPGVTPRVVDSRLRRLLNGS